MDEPMISPEAARAITAGFLVVTNLVPLAGALTLGWEVGTILYLYWLESVIVGGLNIVKMALAQGMPAQRRVRKREPIGAEDLERLTEIEQAWGKRAPRAARFLRQVRQEAEARTQAALSSAAPPPPVESALTALAPGMTILGKLFLIAFFTVHYGIFMAGHVAFLFAFFGPPDIPLFDAVLMLGLLLASHVLSLVTYFLLRGEYRRVNVAEQMSRPYGRIVVMHVTILIGGLLVKSLGAPILALAVMVALKTAIDLAAHLRSHARFESTPTLSAA